MERGLGVLMECFPNRLVSFELAWELLNDLDDKKFLQAIKDICSKTVELYPDTNVIALIRQKVEERTERLLLGGESDAEYSLRRLETGR